MEYFTLHNSSKDIQQNISGTKEIFETKYTIPKQMRNILLSILRHKTKVPGQFSYSKLKTVYFDDAKNNSYFDSRDGNLDKKKYRLREYVNPEQGGAFYSLEVKIRYNTKTSKLKKLIYKILPENYRLTTFRDLINTFEKTLNCSLSFLYLESPEAELFADTMIYYERFRFDDYHGNTRYNLDTNIMVYPHVKFNIESSNGIYLEHDIFEIKSDKVKTLPPFLRELNLDLQSFSKFVWGKELHI